MRYHTPAIPITPTVSRIFAISLAVNEPFVAHKKCSKARWTSPPVVNSFLKTKLSASNASINNKHRTLKNHTASAKNQDSTPSHGTWSEFQIEGSGADPSRVWSEYLFRHQCLVSYLTMGMAIRRHLEFVCVFLCWRWWYWDGLEGSKYLIRNLEAGGEEDSGMTMVKATMGMGCLTSRVLLLLLLWDSNWGPVWSRYSAYRRPWCYIPSRAFRPEAPFLLKEAAVRLLGVQKAKRTVGLL